MVCPRAALMPRLRMGVGGRRVAAEDRAQVANSICTTHLASKLSKTGLSSDPAGRSHIWQTAKQGERGVCTAKKSTSLSDPRPIRPVTTVQPAAQLGGEKGLTDSDYVIPWCGGQDPVDHQELAVRVKRLPSQIK